MKFKEIKIDEYGVGIVTKQNATKDVPVGGEYMNVKKLGLNKKPKKKTKKLKANYNRNELPQIKNKQLENLKHTLETIKVKDLIPVQEERIVENFKKQVDNIVAGDYNPIIIDSKNRIVNGHHRYTALQMLGIKEADVARLPYTLENILEVFEAHHFKNPKNTFLTKADTAYDFLRVGKTISNLSNAKKSDNRDEPDVMVVPFGGEKEKKHLQKGLKKAGYKTQDADKKGDDGHVDETKEAPRGTYFTKSGNLVKGRLSKKAKQRGARETDPKDKTRSKVPPVTQSNENFADGKKKVNEVLDNPAPYTWRKNEFGFPTAEAKELGLHISFDGRNQPDWEVSFYREQDDGSIVMNRPTGQGQEFQVFATVNAAIKDFMKMQDDVEGLTLDARKDGGVDGQGRVSLYRRMMNNYAKKLGWEFEEWDEGRMVAMGIYKPRTNENFADGKKKGKSRPGRVKRSGASCKGSVTDLRKRAKGASGEKRQMYHWCANMKSGRSKK